MPAPKSSKETGGGGDVYDLLAPAYEMLASQTRIASECEAVAAHLRTVGAVRVLDAGCAIGLHAMELARRGFSVAGIDLSKSMIREANAQAAGTNLAVRFFSGDFKGLGVLPGHPFDAVLCLGNTLASTKAGRETQQTLRAFHNALRRGGLLVVQIRDLSTIRRTGHTFPVRSLRREGGEWILLRRHDPHPKGIRFLSTLLYRRDLDSEWEVRTSDNVMPVRGPSEWRRALSSAGFERIRIASDLTGAPRRARGGADLVLIARRG